MTVNAAPPMAPAIDLVHLARQSLGDEGLEAELLGLFDRQSAASVREIAAGLRADLAGSARLAHKLRGSALAVGASRVAEAAANLEALCEGARPQTADCAQAQAALADAVADARRAIAALTA